MQNSFGTGTGVSCMSVKSSKAIPPIKNALLYQCSVNFYHENMPQRNAEYKSVSLNWQISCMIFNVYGSVHHNNIRIYIQQDATLHSLFYLQNALHVSGGTSTHHQESKQLYLQHLVFVTPLLLSAAIVEEMELVSVCCGWPPTAHSKQFQSCLRT
jgi:hypothetical protein